jgi:hypothetical protein
MPTPAIFKLESKFKDLLEFLIFQSVRKYKYFVHKFHRKNSKSAPNLNSPAFWMFDNKIVNDLVSFCSATHPDRIDSLEEIGSGLHCFWLGCVQKATDDSLTGRILFLLCLLALFSVIPTLVFFACRCAAGGDFSSGGVGFGAADGAHRSEAERFTEGFGGDSWELMMKRLEDCIYSDRHRLEKTRK